MKMKIKDCWILLPCLPFYAMVFAWVDNLPVWDDFSMPLAWITKYSKVDFYDKLGMLTGQYGEHRLIPSKLLYLGYYYLTGNINFRVICIIGDLQLLVVALTGIHFIRKYFINWRLLAFIFCLLVFDCNTYENASMCMNAVGNYGQVAFFMFTLYLYDLNRKWLPAAAIIQVLCAYSNGNGMLAMMIIPFFCWLKGDRHKLIVSGIIGVVCVTLNFTFHHSEVMPTTIAFDLSRSITYFVRMSGAHFNFDYSFWIGIGVLGILAYVIPKNPKDWESAGMICILAFAVGTMLLATYFRGNTSDAQFQTSRYLIYPQLMIGCIIFFVFKKLKSNQIKWSIGPTILAGMVFAWSHNFAFGQLGFQRTYDRAHIYRYYYPNQAEAEKICAEAEVEGIYSIEESR